MQEENIGTALLWVTPVYDWSRTLYCVGETLMRILCCRATMNRVDIWVMFEVCFHVLTEIWASFSVRDTFFLCISSCILRQQPWTLTTRSAAQVTQGRMLFFLCVGHSVNVVQCAALSKSEDVWEGIKAFLCLHAPKEGLFDMSTSTDIPILILKATLNTSWVSEIKSYFFHV